MSVPTTSSSEQTAQFDPIAFLQQEYERLGAEHVSTLERAHSYEQRLPLHDKLAAFWSRPELDELIPVIASSVRTAIAAVPLTPEDGVARCLAQNTPESRATWERELAAAQRKYGYGKPLSARQPSAPPAA